MKRIGILSGLALAALALTNCSTKEIEIASEVVAEKEGVPFEIIALPSVETRTVAGEGLTTTWDATNDKLSVFHRTANTGSFTNDGEFSVANAETGTFSGTITENIPAAGNSYDWVAIYPYSSYLLSLADPVGEQGGYYYIGCNSQKAQLQDGTGSNAHLAGYKSDNTGNFPLWGKAENVAYNATASGFVSPAISMNQVASVLAFNITNSTSEAISVSSIEFTATEDIVGAYYIDFTGTTPAFTPYNNYQSATAKLEVTNGTIAAGGTGTFYMGIKPFTVEGTDTEPKTLSMKVTTELGDTQVKTFNVTKTMTFSPNKFKNVNMVWNTEHVGDVIPEEPDTDDYVLVENLSNVTSGYYLIVNYDPVNVEDSFILKNDQLTSKTQAAATLNDIYGLTISSDEKIITTDADNVKWCFIAQGTNEFKIKSAAPESSYYLLCKEDENSGLRIATWNYSGWQNTWTVSEKDLQPGDSDYNTFLLSTTVGSVTRYLSVYISNPDWRTYTTSSTGWNYIRLYKKGTPLPSSGIGFGTTSYEFTLNDSDYAAFTGQPLTNPNNVSVTWSSSNTQLASVSNGTVTFVPNKTGSTTISATFAGNQTYKSETVSYTITVNQNDAGLSLPFTETFANPERTSTFNGGTGDLVCDNDGWDTSNGAPFNGSAKFGASSAKGIATTPALNYSGNATLTFDAAAWNKDNEGKILDLAVSSGHIYSDASLMNEIPSVTLAQASWTTFTVYLKDVEAPFTVTFSAQNKNNNRFFLDNISIVEGIDSSIETVADPTFSPAGGTYTAAQNVTISCSSSGASIYYTTDRSTPTASSTLYSSPISVSETMTIKAIAIKDGTSSNVVTAAYTINLPTVDYVTLDWSFPGGSSADLTAIAGVTASGLGNDYASGNAPYLIKFDTTGDYIMVKTDKSIGDVSVDYNMLGGSTTSYLEIYESSDGETWGSKIDNLPIAGSQNSTGTVTSTADFNSASRYVKIQFKKGSNIGIGGIRIRHEKPATTTVATPTFSPNGGTFTSAQNVTISCETAGASIYYTTDDSTPTSSSSIYNGPISVTSTTTIKAIAIKNGISSDVASALFTINGGSNNPTTGTTLFSCDFGTSAVALANYTGGTSYNNASTITYIASDASKVKISTDNATNMTSGNLYFNGKSNSIGYTATIAGIKTYGATKVTVTWAANNTSSAVYISESSTAQVSSVNSASNSAVFTLSGTETTISLVFTNIAKANTRIDNVAVYYGDTIN